jgi:alkylhydroperoxidase family enzyme
VTPWLAELGRTARGLVDAWLPTGRGVTARSRERLVLAVTEVNGCRFTEWVHSAWSEFLGDDDADDVIEVLVDYARASARAGTPLEPAVLVDVLPDDLLRSIRATVAMAEVSTLVGNTADDLVDQLAGRTPFEPARAARGAATVVSVLPFAAPMFVIAGAMRVTTRLSPPMPTVRVPPTEDANLVVHMLSEAVPSLLRNALVRAVVLALPVPLTIGVRAEETAATVRLGREQILIENGLRDDVIVVIDGGLEVLLDAAARALSRELQTLTPEQP